ncbi:hypothetical protein A5893_13010 [Pedobacter psychrophilus]|uniref:Uncharacterized protein n=1 Tax=Pedobacter psychrophilus TaxID=1826909 RepID=A0A179DD31_9SPHI|nr:hypothetical protein [Pedobacter psychrophilus]OAQ38951.1 hypothetical protein A5893_13010 [Pedobacter psychrophilus]
MKFITDYFNAEKFESLFFVGIGILAIVSGIYFWFVIKEPFQKGIAIPLILIAFIQITVGAIVYVRSPKDILTVQNIVKIEPEKIQTIEIPRMELVMKNFVVYRYVEIALMLLGLILYFYFPSISFWKGIGLGLFMQAGFMLLLDFFAEKRGKEYLQHLTILMTENV